MWTRRGARHCVIIRNQSESSIDSEGERMDRGRMRNIVMRFEDMEVRRGRKEDFENEVE
jgi:hypothetical protein